MEYGIFSAGIEMGVIGLDLQCHLAISIKNSTSLLYIHLGRPRFVTRPNALL